VSSFTAQRRGVIGLGTMLGNPMRAALTPILMVSCGRRWPAAAAKKICLAAASVLAWSTKFQSHSWFIHKAFSDAPAGRGLACATRFLAAYDNAKPARRVSAGNPPGAGQGVAISGPGPRPPEHMCWQS